MRIGIDGFNLAMRNGTGIATYARNLSHCLKTLGHQVDVLYGMNLPDNTPPILLETLFFDDLGQEQSHQSPKFFSSGWFAEHTANIAGHKAVEIPIFGRVDSRSLADRLPEFDRLLNVPNLFRTANRYFNRTGKFLPVIVPDPPDIMHWTYPLPIRVKGTKNVYTIHDLVPLRLPFTTLDNKTAHFKLIRAIVNAQAAICTVSNASRRDILSYFPAAETRIFNTYQSLKSGQSRITPLTPGNLARISALHSLTYGSYFLFFGSLEPKKNIGRLIEAMLAAHPSRKLVIIGAKSWKTDTELRYLAPAQAAGYVISIDYLPEADLADLIRGARAVLFPSLIEGFGLPILESLALGTPVLTSREGALPETAGDAALFVDAYSAQSIAEGITRLDRDDALCAHLQALGPKQAEKFSLQSYQQNLDAMYRRIIAPENNPFTIAKPLSLPQAIQSKPIRISR